MDDIAIIGGGAAGLAAAVEAGSALRRARKRASIVVYEADERVGRSILRSGNGRCNYTNGTIGLFGPVGAGEENGGQVGGDAGEVYHNTDFVAAALTNLEMTESERLGKRASSGLRENAVNSFFEELGLVFREEDDGRRYPLSGKAATILNLLRASLDAYGVRVECETPLVEVEPCEGAEGPYFTLHVKGGKLLRARHVIVATGGNTARRMLDRVDSVDFVETRPVLAPLAVKEKDVARRMDNVRVKCTVQLVRRDGSGERIVDCEKGEVLFRKYGVSGIAIFNLSREARPGDVVRIDLIDWLNEASVVELLMRHRKRIAARTDNEPSCGRLLLGILQESIADVVLLRAGLKEKDSAKKDVIPRLAHVLHAFDFTVEGIGDAALAQVHRGGFAVGGECGVSPADLGVPGIPGLHIVGEALDVDGPCGGYNLHWAWASGMLAARSIVDSLE